MISNFCIREYHSAYGPRVRRTTEPFDLNLGPSLGLIHRRALIEDTGLEPGGADVLVSPQQLVDWSSGVQLSLPAGTLRSIDRGHFSSLRRAVVAAGSTVHICPDYEGYVVTVAATVDGVPTQLVVDTGSPAVLLFGDAAAARAMANSDGEATPRSHEVVVGGANFHVPIRFSPRFRLADNCDIDGALGMSILRSCTLVMSAYGGGIASTGS